MSVCWGLGERWGACVFCRVVGVCWCVGVHVCLLGFEGEVGCMRVLKSRERKLPVWISKLGQIPIPHPHPSESIVE